METFHGGRVPGQSRVSARRIVPLALAALLVAGCIDEGDSSPNSGPYVRAPGGSSGSTGHPLLSYRVLVQAPSADIGRSFDVQAVYAAIAYWAEKGYDIRATTDARESNRQVEFIKDWGGTTLGESCVTSDPDQRFCRVTVGLGDSRCDHQWTHFDRATIERIATHELGHAVGLVHSPDRRSVMYATQDTNYADPCLLSSGLMHVEAGSTSTFYPLTLDRLGVLSYKLVEEESGSFDSWIALGDTCCWARHTGMASASDSARLDPGDYTLLVKCRNFFDTCAISYKVFKQE